MKKEEININVLYTSEHVDKENLYLNWSENIITLFKSFIGVYPQFKVNSKIIVMENFSSMGRLLGGKSLTLIILSDKLIKFEKLCVDYQTLKVPVIISERDVEDYIEVFANETVHYLTDFNRKFFNEGYANHLTRSKGNEPVLNYICSVVDNWLLNLGIVKIEYSKKQSILLGTVPPSLYDYRLQIKMYLEKEGYKVDIFSTNISNKENRNELFLDACKDHDVAIHFLNEYLKRHQNDESSFFEDEIGQLIEYFKVLGGKLFHGFCWIAPQLEVQHDNSLRNTIDFVKKTSAKSHLFHSYQVSIGEFKKLLISRLTFFYDKKNHPATDEKNSIIIYDYKDLEKGDYLCDKLSKEYPNLLSFKDYKKNEIELFDYSKMSLFKNILLYIEKVEEEWVASMIKHLMKIVENSGENNIIVYCGREYSILKELENYDLQIEHIET